MAKLPSIQRLRVRLLLGVIFLLTWGTSGHAQTANFTNDNPLCGNSIINFHASMDPDNADDYTFFWEFGDGKTGQGKDVPHDFKVPPGGSHAPFTVKLTATNKTTSYNYYSTQTITVSPAPIGSLEDVFFPSDPFNNCINSPTPQNPNFTITVQNTSQYPELITGYLIDWGDGSPSESYSKNTFPATLTHPYTKLGLFKLKLTVTGDNGCTNTKEYNVKNQSNPALVLGSPGSTEGCWPVTFTFPLTGITDNDSETNYLCDFGDGIQITLSQQDVLDHGSTITHQYNKSSCDQPDKAFTLSVKAFNSCSYTILTVGGIKVTSMPQPLFDAVNLCEGEPVQFNNYTISDCSNKVSYTWDFGDGSPTKTTTDISSFQHLFPTTNNVYTVTLTVHSSCQDISIHKDITLTRTPTADFTLSPPQGCLNTTSPLVVEATNKSTGEYQNLLWSVVSPATGWAFSQGDGPNTTNPHFSFTKKGNYTISLVASNSCSSNEKRIVIMVNDVPSADLPPISPQCDNYTFDASNSSIFKINTIQNEIVTAKWAITPSSGWSFDPTTNDESLTPKINFSTPGVYTISVSLSNDCGTTTKNTTLTINESIHADHTYTPATGCAPIQIDFTDHSTGTNPRHTWTVTPATYDFINSNPSSSDVHIRFNEAGIYTVTHTVTGDCNTDTKASIITISAIPKVTLQPIADQCDPSFKLIIDNTNLQINNNGVPLTSTNWNVSSTSTTGISFADGTHSNSEYPHIQFTKTGQYTVSVTVKNDCGTTIVSQTFSILEHAVESATPSTTSGCLPLSVGFTDQSTGDHLVHNWSVSPATGWTMTGSTTDPSPSIIFNKIGVYTVTHKAANQCGSNQHDYIITVKDIPTATLAPFANTCDSYTFNAGTQNFNVTLNQNAPSEVSYLWTVTPNQGVTFINGTNPNSQYPSIQIADTGVFVIKAALTNACGNSEVQQSISITKSPQIALIPSLSNNCLPSDLTFTGKVHGQNLTYQWDVSPNNGVYFQNSNQNSPSPQIRFTQPGLYEVTLTASNNCGTDVHKWTEDIIGKPAILFTQIPNTCDNYTLTAENFVTVEDNRNAIKSYNWTITPSSGFTYKDGTSATSEFPHILFTDAATYTLTMEATNDCGVSSPATRSFTVDKFIQVTVDPDSKVCAGPDLIKLTGYPSGGNWSILPSSASGQLRIIGSDTYFDPSLPGEYTFTYKRGSSYCFSEANNKITVITLPVVNAGSDFSICSNETNSHLLGGTPVGGTWSGIGVTGSSFSANGLTVGAYILKYSYTDPITACINTDQLIANVLNVPNTGFTAPPGCKDKPLTFTPFGTANTHYSWDFGDGQTGISTGPIDHTYHLGGEYTVTLASSDPNNCALTSSKIIKVQDEKAIFSTSGECTPLSVAFTDQSIGDNLTHNWTVSPATDYTIMPSSTSASPTITFNTAGIYTVTHTTSTTCGSDHHDYIIKVKDKPTATITPFSDACDSYTFNANASNFQVDQKQNDIVTYLWSVTPSSAVTFLNSTGNTEKYPIIQIADTGVFIIKVKLTGECGSTETQRIINITRKPVIALSQVFNDQCIPSDLSFTGTVYGQKLNYQWTVSPNTGVIFQNSTNSTSARPQIRFTQPGKYKVLLKVSNYCGVDNVEWENTIKSAPTINFNAIPDTCDNYMLKTEKFVTIIDHDSPVTQYNWSVVPNTGIEFRDGTDNTSAHPHILFSIEGNYQVTLSATNDCGVTTNSRSFTVDKFIQVTVGPDSTFCTNPDLIKLTGIPSGGYWKILPTSASSLLKVNGSITYFDPSLPGIYTLTYHRGNSYCYSEASKKFTVVALPVVDAGRDFNICSNETKPFTLNGTPGGGTWTGTGITGNTFSPIGLPIGNYILKYTYTDPNTLCVNTDQLIAHVLDVPVTGFDVQIQGCKDQLITYTPFGPANTTFNWDFGDGQTGSSTGPITHIYHAGDTYTVNMISADQNSCAYSTSKKISIQGNITMPVVSYTPTDGCGPLTVSFKVDTTGTTGNGQKHQWDFGNGIVVSDAITSKDITYNPGIADTSYTVHFTISNSCFSKTVDYVIPVRSKPNSNFSFPHPYECSPASVHFKNQTVDRRASFYWDFDDGTTSKEYEPTHIFTTGKIAKEFKIKLVSDNGCGKDSITKSLLVKPNTIEAFIKMSARQACPGELVSFTNLSTDTVSRISNYYWDFGDGTIVHTWDATHAYATSGTFIIKLFVDNGCSKAEKTDQIEILPVPTLQIASLDSICKLDTLKLEGSSNEGGLINGKWDLGDGSSETGLKATHVYNTVGWHTITFEAAYATSILQCTSIKTKRVYIKEIPLLPSLPDLSGCSPFSVSIPSPGTDAYLWNYGDDNIWTASSKHTYINTGAQPIRRKVTIIAENNFTCKVTSSFWVTIYPTPVAKISARSEGGYPETVYFKNESINSPTCEWIFPDGSTSTSCDSTMYRFYHNGLTRIYLKSSNQYGCTDTTSIVHETVMKGLFVPNALQPSNSDPLVKIFKPIGIGLKTYHLGIYDIWGNSIWETEKINDTETEEGWNGQSKSGKDLPQGVYIWRITATFIDGTSWKGMKQADNKTRTEGTITLIR